MSCSPAPVYPSCGPVCLPTTCVRCSCGPCRCDLLPADPVACRPTVVGKHNRLTVNECLAGFTLPLSGCRAHSRSDYVAMVRRRGTASACLKYPAFDIGADGSLVFRFDPKILDLSPGRYKVEVRRGCDSCAVLELVVPRCVTGSRIETIATHTVTPVTTGPTEVIVFADIVTLSIDLCRALEKNQTVLPLTAADAAALCAIVLCCPVQLVLDDGVNREVVEFSGCVDGAVVVERGVAGTKPTRFPAGTTLRFEWTASNIQHECEGCP